MKFTITMKDPDGPDVCIREAAKQAVDQIEGVDEDEQEYLVDSRADKLHDFVSQWLKHGEYVSIEFDTEAGTATLKKAKQWRVRL